jgi:glucan biosynthesis protein C
VAGRKRAEAAREGMAEQLEWAGRRGNLRGRHTVTLEAAQPAHAVTAAAAIGAGQRTSSEESRRIQALRGFACLLLVAFHVIGSRATSGLHAGDDSLYRHFANLLQHVRMPLFTFLSGFVYAYRPVLEGRFRAFARRKFMRLWLPLVVVSTLYFLVAMVAPADVTGKVPLGQMWRIYLFPYVHLWFLQAVILIFAAVLVLERLRLLSTPQRYAIALVLAMAIHLSLDMAGDENSLFSLLQALYLLPFFLLGLGANRFRRLLLQPAVIWTCVILFCATMTLHAVFLLQQGHVTERGSLLGLMIGATSAVALVGTFPRLRPLERIGAYSFTIYLFHPFFVAGMRTMLKISGIVSAEVIFVLGLAAGVIGPVVLESLFGDKRPLNALLLGKSTSQRAPKSAREAPSVA